MEPDKLLKQAQEAEDAKGLRALRRYSRSLWVLREKGYSLRGIASWLGERGVIATHVEVRRVLLESLTKRQKAVHFVIDEEPIAAEAYLKRQKK